MDFLISIGGIYGCFMFFGVFQEKLFAFFNQFIHAFRFKTEYKGGKFTFPFINNVTMCLVGVAINLLLSSLLNTKKENVLTLRYSIEAGFLIEASMICS